LGNYQKLTLISLFVEDFVENTLETLSLKASEKPEHNFISAGEGQCL
jgi:hypothetical protein